MDKHIYRMTTETDENGKIEICFFDAFVRKETASYITIGLSAYGGELLVKIKKSLMRGYGGYYVYTIQEGLNIAKGLLQKELASNEILVSNMVNRNEHLKDAIQRIDIKLSEDLND